MMKIYLVNFAVPELHQAQKTLNRSALCFGVDKCVSYNKHTVKRTEFYKKHKNIFDQERGAGYWLWRPFIIFEALQAAEEGDIVIYSDSDSEITAPVDPLVNLCREKGGILLFHAHDPRDKHLNIMWTKRDCFILMNADEPRFHEAEQIASSPQLYQKNRLSMAFVREWLDYCSDERILTDMPNRCNLDDYEAFKGHCHDQSVLSLLFVRYGLEAFRDPSQRGNYLKMPSFRVPGELAQGSSYSPFPYENSPYGAIFEKRIKQKRHLFQMVKDLRKKVFPSAATHAFETERRITQKKRISIGITTFEHRFETYFIPLLSQLLRFAPDTEIIVVVNGEHNADFSEEYRQQMLLFLATQRNVFPVFFPQFRGVAKLWNTIAIHASQDYILLMNDDIMVDDPRFVALIEEHLQDNRFRSFTINKSFSHFVVARGELDALGYFDERLLGIGEEDGDFVWRYMEKFGEPLPNVDLECFKNFSEKTSNYQPVNIINHSGSKYSRFNRNFMFHEKYEEDHNGFKGMFDYTVRCKSPGLPQYPNERFYRQNKNKL